MSADTEIGKPLPRGVVDVQREYVGASGNKPGIEKQLAQLRHEIRNLRRQFDDENYPPDRSAVVSLTFLAAGMGAVLAAMFIRRRLA